jgi:RHS repeat-associated protein
MRRYFFLFLMFPLMLIAETRTVDLQEFGKVVYYIEDGLCEKIVRLSPSGEIKYEHQYHYNDCQQVVSESLIGSLGEINYSGNIQEGYLSATSPFGEERWSCEDHSTFEKSSIERVYDKEGRLTQKGSTLLVYQADKLTAVLTEEHKVFFSYDDQGRKVSKKCLSKTGEEEEYYLYLGKQEIGSTSIDGRLKWLRIPGLSSHPDLVRAIAIETEDATYAPIYDLRWNIVKLVNMEDGRVLETRPDPFEQNLAELEGCPWTFCCKRYDRDTHLVDFGYRYYSIDLKEWTSLDPLMQDSNPYRYCFNDPLQFLDPDGRAGFLIPILTYAGGTLSCPLWGPYALATAAGAAAAYYGCEAYEYYSKKHKKPPFTWDDLGDDPCRCPEKGFEWRGRGDPKSGEGAWYNPETNEKLHPDFNHNGDVELHWDYKGPNNDEARIFIDGTWAWK